jgi:hypothetical protein
LQTFACRSLRVIRYRLAKVKVIRDECTCGNLTEGGHTRGMTPTPVILDCDRGTTTRSRSCLRWPRRAGLVAVTTVSGNQTLDKTTVNALKVLD